MDDDMDARASAPMQVWAYLCVYERERLRVCVCVIICV
jgi:hypothetical protein